MSEHHFITKNKQGEKLDIEIDWDEGSRRYHLKINGVVEPVIEDMLNENPNPQNLNHFIRSLKYRNIQLPERMVKELEADRRYNHGQKNVRHQVDGDLYFRQELI
jgi:hypothetical protein